MTDTTRTPDFQRQLDGITQDLAELGTAWARYGLSVGRLALETSARTLSTTAKRLGEIAETLPRPPADAASRVVIDAKAEASAES